MDLFIYDNYTLELNKPEVLLINEFEKLWEPKRNKVKGDAQGTQRQLAMKEFAYMYLVYDWKSPYSEYSDSEKIEAALEDSGLTNEQIQDKLLVAACKKYQELQQSRVLKLLNSAYRAVDELRRFFDEVDLQERDPETGKPIYKSNDIIANIANLGKTVGGLEELEYMVKKQKEKERGLRGQAQAGMFD